MNCRVFIISLLVSFFSHGWFFFLSLSSLMFILKPPRTSFRSVTRALWLTWRIFNPLLLSLPPATQPAPLHPSLLPDQRYGHHVTCHWSVSRFNREEMRDEPGRKGRGSYILKGLQHLLKAWTLYYPLVCVCVIYSSQSKGTFRRKRDLNSDLFTLLISNMWV